MEIVCAESGIALWTFPLSGFVASLQAVETEDVETLSEDCVLLLHLTGRTGQLFLHRTAASTVTHRFHIDHLNNNNNI